MNTAVHRFAVIGNGYMAKRHMACIDQHPRAELGLLINRRTVLKSALADTKEGASFATDEDLLAFLRRLPELNAILVCTPDDTHARSVAGLLPSDKLILCEKPLARTREEFQTLLGLPASAKRQVAVGMNVRFRRKFGHLKRHLDEGHLGRINFVTARYHSNISVVLEGKAKSWWFDFPPTIKPFLHGGAIHLIDLLRFLFGEIAEVFCVQVPTHAGGKLGGDSFIIATRFKSGAVGSITITGTSFAPNAFQIAYDGEKGSVTDATSHVLGPDSSVVASALPEDDNADLMRQLDHLIAVLDGTTTPLNSLAEAYMNFCVISACEASLASSSWTRVSNG